MQTAVKTQTGHKKKCKFCFSSQGVQCDNLSHSDLEEEFDKIIVTLPLPKCARVPLISGLLTPLVSLVVPISNTRAGAIFSHWMYKNENYLVI